MIKELLTRPVSYWFKYHPLLTFAPFALLYFCIAYFLYTPELEGDETRYLVFAQNLVQGYYSPPPPNINLWSGPGYPFILVPFVWLKLPNIYPVLLNAVFQYLGVIMVFLTLKSITSTRTTIIYSLATALFYPSFIWFMPMLYTESLAFFLIALLSWFIVCKLNSKSGILLAGITLGFLVLSKIAFGYVLIVLCAIYGVRSLIKKSSSSATIKVLFIGLIVNIPYLLYTHSLTGKILYWGTAGGANFYWMTTPFEGEYGEWMGEELKRPPLNKSQIYLNHADFLNRIDTLDQVSKDEAFTSEGIHNLKNHPKKYVRNVVYNMSRILFDAPLYFVSPTYKYPLRILPILLLLPFFIKSLYLLIRNRKSVSPPIFMLILFSAAYFGLSSLVSAYNRQFIIMVPCLMILTAYGLEKFGNNKIVGQKIW